MHYTYETELLCYRRTHKQVKIRLQQPTGEVTIREIWIEEERINNIVITWTCAWISYRNCVNQRNSSFHVSFFFFGETVTFSIYIVFNCLYSSSTKHIMYKTAMQLLVLRMLCRKLEGASLGFELLMGLNCGLLLDLDPEACYWADVRYKRADHVPESHFLFSNINI